MRFRELTLRKDPQCAVCGETPSIRTLKAYEGYCAPAPEEHMDMTVKELKERMDRGDAPTLIDVREPNEHAICRIPGAVLIPQAQLPKQIGAFDRNQEIVVHCKSGGRSSRAVAWMAHQGFTNVRNLTGGILAWIDQIDPSQRKY